LHDRKKYIWAATLCPGYDDRKIPGRAGLYQHRDNGEYYEKTFDAAFESSPDWILITSFNEWWEHTHIEPSVNYGYTYLDMTALFSSEFKGIQLIPEITIQKTVDKSHIDTDESVTVTVTIANRGNGSAVNISIAENISKFELLESIIPQKIDRMLPSDVVNYQMTLRAKGDGTIEIPGTTARFEDVYGEEHEVTSESIEVTVFRPQVASTYTCVILIVIAVILIMAVFLKKSEER
ncbi:MAG: glycoside hydrolase family 99-like domain-containing protein, partial [Methanomicrobia archaeon]|nr:glycoside hydrolase family 99-like domain-containing protein [Methanomicrobia archaeon]